MFIQNNTFIFMKYKILVWGAKLLVKNLLEATLFKCNSFWLWRLIIELFSVLLFLSEICVLKIIYHTGICNSQLLLSLKKFILNTKLRRLIIKEFRIIFINFQESDCFLFLNTKIVFISTRIAPIIPQIWSRM